MYVNKLLYYCKVLTIKLKIMNVLSLFDGMSCGQIALDRLGIKVDNYFASEIDKYAMQVTSKNYPNTKHIGSVTDIKSEYFTDIHLLIGGSSCQNFSFAGNRIGMSTDEDIDILSLDQYLLLKDSGFSFKGESYLFWEYVRVLRETKPKFFLLENVKMSKKWEDVITKAIGVSPIMINSRVKSAQNRPRLYWTNIPNIENIEKDSNVTFKDICESEGEINGYTLSEKATDRAYNNKRSRSFYIDKDKVGTLQANQYKQSTDSLFLKYGENEARKVTPIECERMQTVPDNYTDCVSNTQRYKMLGNGWTVDVIAHIFKNLK